MNKLNFLLLGGLVVLAACSTAKAPNNVAQNYPTVDGAGLNTTIQGIGANDLLHSPGSVLSKRSVYFDFDSSLLKAEYQELVKAHSRYLVENSNRSVTIQGNTDNRGSSEYNLALGQRRSAAVRSAMRVLGVPENQVEAVSFGKEKLRALGNDEASHAENRRADIVYNNE